METVPAKHMIFHAKKPGAWFGADYNMNIYRGCPHGCIYCDSRSDCYGNERFDTVKVKENALIIIRDDLRRKVKSGVIATGAMSDPYNPFEESLKLSRNAFELINAFGFGVAIATKSPLVTRDIDVLNDIKKHSPVLVKMTITTADTALCRKVEPYAAASAERFAALKTLSEQGICCGVLMMPILPFINDTEENIVSIIRQTRAAGAQFIYPAMGMTLRNGNREYYYKNLDESFPGLKEKYVKRYGNRYQCTAPDAKRLWAILQEECARLGLLYDMRSIIRRYQSGYGDRQLTLWTR